DIGPYERVARMICDRRKRFQISRIGQLVNHQHLIFSVADQMPNDGRAYESGTSGDKEPLRHHRSSYLKGVTNSAKRPSARSFSDSAASAGATGQSIVSVGSFHTIPCSSSGA